MPHLDKVVHLCEYLVLAWLLAQAVRLSRPEGREGWLLAWMLAAAYGLLMEGVQVMVPWRSADWVDVFVNGIGAGLGVWFGPRLRVVSDRFRQKGV